MLMNVLFYPPVNALVRHILRPFASWIHPDLHPRITGIVKVALESGNSLLLKVNPTSYLGKVLFFRGIEAYEWHAVKIFIDVAKQSKYFLDIGANIGYYSCLGALHNPRLRVFSFEPFWSPYKFLLENIILNNLSTITPVQKALSNCIEKKQFFVSQDPSFTQLDDHLTTTGGFNQVLSSRTSLTQNFEVETDTIDRYWSASDCRHEVVDLIKIDTEASEHLVLAGGANVLGNHQPVIFCEVLPGQVGAEIERLVKAYGYLIFSVREEGLVPAPSLRNAMMEYKEYLFVHPNRISVVEKYLVHA